MQSQVEQEWTALSDTYEKLSQRYHAAYQRINSFQEGTEAIALLEQRKPIEAELGKIREAVQVCDAIRTDFAKNAKLHAEVAEHSKNLQNLQHKTAVAEMHGLTPGSSVPRAKKLVTESREGLKKARRLKKEIKQFNLRDNDYYNKCIKEAEELVKPFRQQFFWLWRRIIEILFGWNFKVTDDEANHLSWQNLRFIVRVHGAKSWLLKWATKLEGDLTDAWGQWRRKKDLLERQQEEARVALKHHADAEVLWARRDSERLKKYLESGRAERSRVTCPMSSGSDAPQVAPTKKKTKTRSKQKSKLVSELVKQDPGGPLWKLFISDDRLKRQVELPDLTDESFATFLIKAFAMVGCHADPTNVAKSLKKIVSYTSESLRRRKQVSYSEPKGWKIFRCGRFRILMDIIEIPQEKLVKGIFIVRYRPDAYLQ